MASRKVITATDTQYSGTLLASLNEQRTHGIFCDVTVIVEDKKFRAHRNILSASSTYFHQLFSVAGQVVELSFVRAEIFAEILNYVYSSKIVGVRTDLLEELIKSGQLLGVRFIADLGVPLSQMKSLTGGVKINSAEAASSDSCKKAVDIEKPIKKQPVLKKDSEIRTAAVNTAAVAVPIDEHKELDKPADCKNKRENSDDVVFCSELIPLKPLGSENKEVKPQSAFPDTVNVSSQPMNINSIDSDQARSTAKAKSSISNIVLINSNPLSQINSSPVTVSDPGQPQTDSIASCPEPVPSKTPVLDNILSCPGPVPSKTPVLDNIVSCPEPVPSKTPVLDNIAPCPEPVPSKTPVLDNIAPCSEPVPSKTPFSDNIASCALLVPSKTPVLDKIAPCSEPVPSKTPFSDNIVSCSEPVPSKTPVLDNIAFCSEPVPSKTPVLDNIASCTEPVPSKTPVLENTEMAERKIIPDMIELSTHQMNINSNISAETSFISSGNSPDDLLPEDVPQSQAQALSVDIHDQRQEQDDVLCSEQVLQKPKVLNNSEVAEQRTDLNIVESASPKMTVNSSISGQTPVTENENSPNNVALNRVTPPQTNSLSDNTSSPNQTPDEVVLCPEFGPPKEGISNNIESFQQRTGTDTIDSASEQMASNSSISAQTPLIENIKSTSEGPLKCVQTYHAHSLPVSKSAPSQAQNDGFCSEISSPNSGVSNNNEVDQEKTVSDITESSTHQMTISNIIPAQTMLIEKPKSSIDTPPKSVTPQMTADSNISDHTLLIQNTESPSEIPVKSAALPMTTIGNISAQTPYIQKRKSPCKAPVKCVTPPMTANSNISPRAPFIQKIKSPSNTTFKCATPPMNANSYISPQTPYIQKNKSPGNTTLKCITPPMNANSYISLQPPYIQKNKSPCNLPLKCVTPSMTANSNISPQTPYIQKIRYPSNIPSKYVTPQMTTNSDFYAQTPFVQKTRLPSNIPSKYVPPYQPNTFSGNMLHYNQMQAGGSTGASSQNHMNPNTMTVNPYPSNNSCSISSFPENHLSPINTLVQQLPSINTFVNKMMSSTSWSSSNTNMFPSSHSNQTNTERAPAFYGPKLQNPQKATFSQQTTSKSGELKIKIGNVNSGSNKDSSGVTGSGSQHIMDGKKIITLDTPSEIGGLSTGCKVYANIGEDTYDIVIPIKREPDEDESGSVDLPNSADGSPDSKRVKLKHEDHYELNVDGKVYYICIVCKRSYVSRTSLRRHYNVHSWEKKYQCHYCEKVFALAEYRTKHEVVHTGAKRYQCLTCGETFMYHKLMSVHMKAAHSQDPQADRKLYRLHPLKSLQGKPLVDTSTAHPSSSASVGNDSVLNNVAKKEAVASEIAVPSSPSKPMTWDNVFDPPGEKAIAKEGQSDGSTEFEFVIPESY